jgi:hypothetical protein
MMKVSESWKKGEIAVGARTARRRREPLPDYGKHGAIQTRLLRHRPDITREQAG